MNQLSENQIARLFTFVEGKNVRWKDVQFELVDHLATAIEDEISQNKNLSFELALSRVYNKFPITGFAKIILEKEKSLHKYWMKKYSHFLMNYFKLPKILILIGLVIIFNSILKISNQTGLWFIYGGLISCAALSFYYRYKKRILSKELRKNYLVTKTFLSISATLNCVIIIMPLYYRESIFFNINANQTWLVAVLSSAMLIYMHAETIAFPKMLRKELKSKYRHLKITFA